MFSISEREKSQDSSWENEAEESQECSYCVRFLGTSSEQSFLIAQYLMYGGMTQIQLCPNHSESQLLIYMHKILHSVDIRISS